MLPDYGRRGVVPAQHPLPPPLVALAERMRTHVALLRVGSLCRSAIPVAAKKEPESRAAREAVTLFCGC